MSAAVHHQPRPQTRSVRAAANTANTANTARPLQPQQPQPEKQTSGPLDVATTSPLSLFLTHLKLLDLDLQPGWPDISPAVFSVTSAVNAQSQKRRIQCVEWALYHLFTIWDPEETASKLKPFFPPLNQVQSINLRSALLRALEQVKKNGFIGRDAVLRKTMLDECKGERLEELLAAFSGAVLKKVVVDDANSDSYHPALAMSLALESRNYTEDKITFSALVLAHKVSLQRLRENKEAARTRFRDFYDLLELKERDVALRDEKFRTLESSSTSQTISDDSRRDMWRTIRSNWSGSERWMETLLYGDSDPKKDGPFGMPFERVWRRVQQDRLPELETKDIGLLEQLDLRVNIQKQRLEKWQAYRESMFGQQSASQPTLSKCKEAGQTYKGINLGFGAHKEFTVANAASRRKINSQGFSLTKEYQSIISNLESGLAGVNSQKSNSLAFLSDRQKLSESSSTEQGDDISEMSDFEDDYLEAFQSQAPIKSFTAKLNEAQRIPIRPKFSRPGFTFGGHSRSPSKPDMSNHERKTSLSLTTPQIPVRKVSPPQELPHFEQRASSPTQSQADQIPESIDNASPSPTRRPKQRPTLSLSERTRLSMAPRKSIFLDDDDDDEPKQPAPYPLNFSLSDSPTKTSPPSIRPLVAEDPEEDLVSRTRRSMAGFEKARQKAQIERRRSQRKSKMPEKKEGSYFPKVQEEQTVVVEELIGAEDMEAVFRSRPKIKASPLPSPTKDFEFDY